MKIFISSVQKEFAKERKAIAKMIREDRWLANFFDEVFLFEETSASAKSAQKVYLEAVADCDIYLGIIGDCYGNARKGFLSPTEQEYDKAAELGKDRLMFVKVNDDKRDEAECQFLKKVSSGVTWHSFEPAEKLKAAVYDALFHWLEDNDLVTNKPFDQSTSRKVELTDLDESKFDDYKSKVKEAKKVRIASGCKPMDVLRKIQAIDKKNGRIVNGAIPLFAAHPEETRGSWEISCIQFYGTEQVKPFPTIHTYNGTVFELVDQALDFVMSHADYSVGRKLTKGCAIEGKEELPNEAVREAIVNAVCHRDYASNACVQVMLFRDRLEVINPGCLPKGTTLEDLSISHDSNPRNHVIARAMSWTSYVEKSGSGTGEIIRLCREAGLADPTFESKTGHFKTIIWRRGYGIGPSQGRVKGPSEGLERGSTKRVQCEGPVKESSERVQYKGPVQIVRAILEQGELSISAIARALGQKAANGYLKRSLSSLVADDILMRTADRLHSNLQKYRLTSKGQALAAKMKEG